jgi:predicted solute-binding protein
LIDLCREVFDVVTMNPPFGALASNTKQELAKKYPFSKNDLLAIFVERGVQLLRVGGRLGAITSRNCFFLPRFQPWREEIILKNTEIEVFADLGNGVLDAAMVEVAAYCLEKKS